MPAVAAIRPLSLATLARLLLPAIVAAWLVSALQKEQATRAEIERGRRALRHALTHRTDVFEAMTHPTLGPIDFIYGKETFGLKHIESGIIAKKEYYKTHSDGGKEWSLSIFDSIPQAIMRGKVVLEHSGRSARIEYKNLIVILVRNTKRAPNQWLLNAYPKIKGQKMPSKIIKKSLK